MSVISIKLAASCMAQDLRDNLPVMVSGPPGVGKSEVGDQVAREVFGAYNPKKDPELYKMFEMFGGVPIIDFRAALRDPVDLRGLPLVNEKTRTTDWLAPGELPVVQNLRKFGPKGLLKFDELNTASPAVINACLGLVLERRIGEHPLIPGWIPVAMGNRLKDKVNVQRLSTAMRSRFGHYEVEADLPAWIEWAEANDIEPLVVGYLKGFRPAHLHVMPVGEENAFPNPRAWVKVARICQTATDDTRLYRIAAQIGDAYAAEFEAFYSTWRDLPSIDEIRKNPKTARCPTYDQPGQAYAIAAGLARTMTRQNFATTMLYADRMGKEFEVMMVVSAVKRDKDIKATKAFGEWFARNSEVII